jgi:HEAT repeat protein
MSEKIPFATVLNALTNTATDFPKRFLPKFSDLMPADVSALQKVWPQVQVSRKRKLLRDLNVLYHEDTLVSFAETAIALMDDPDPLVRAQAIRLLDETFDIRLLPRLLQIESNDPDVGVRTETATALGNFVRLGELGEIPVELKQRVEEILFSAAREERNAYLQRAALESLGYANRPDVDELIAAAFERPDTHWVASALLAMSRSADARWQEQILEALGHEDSQVRLLAVQAAGELEIKPTRQFLLTMLDDEEDEDVFQAVIWSLSQIGGEDVRTYLQALLDVAEDDEAIEYLEDALANLSFTEDMENFDLLAVDPDDDLEGLDEIDETDESEEKG